MLTTTVGDAVPSLMPITDRRRGCRSSRRSPRPRANPATGGRAAVGRPHHGLGQRQLAGEVLVTGGDLVDPVPYSARTSSSSRGRRRRSFTQTASWTLSTAARSWETKSVVPWLRPSDPVEAALLERGVADREHLVDEQHVRDRGTRRPRSRAASASRSSRTSPGRSIGGSSSANADDLVEAGGRPRVGCMPMQRAVDEHVLAPGELRVDAGAHLDQRADPPGDVDASRRTGTSRR